MKMRSILAITLTAAPLIITGCGSDSDSKSDKGPVNKLPSNSSLEALVGTWLTPMCQYNQFYQETGTSDYKRTVMTVTADGIVMSDNIYSDDNCTTVVSSSRSEFTYSDAGKVVDVDTGLEMRNITLDPQTPPYHWTVYVNPLLNQMIMTPGSMTHATQMTLGTRYIKQDADLSYQPGKQHITVLGHFGLDFKTGEQAQIPAVNDVATIAWSSGQYPSGSGWGQGIWLRDEKDNDDDPGSVFVHATGETELSAVTSGPASWPKTTDVIQPVTKDQVYVVRRSDGSLVKLKVLNTPDPDEQDWAILVEYELM